jgi:hypothetical protein
LEVLIDARDRARSRVGSSSSAGKGELGRGGDPGELGRGGDPVEIERAGEPGEIERAGKWRSFYVPDDFHDMLIAEVELSSGSKDYFLCVIDDSGQMVDPESGDNLGWDYECISRWVPFDEFLTWANDDV